MASRSDTAPTPGASADSVAATLASAPFVRLRCRADGDGLAAVGLLARALRRADVPFQVRVDSLWADPPVVDDGLLACVGSEHPAADVTIAPDNGPVSLAAYQIAADVCGDDVPDPVVALAGAVAAGAHPESVAGSLVETATAAERVSRRPGVATPVADPIDGLAHSTLVHAPFSGDRDAAAAALPSPPSSEAEPLDADARRSIASTVALAVASDGDAPPHAAEAVERALRPYATPTGPVATIGGLADVLTAAAREQPGTGVAVALGHGGSDAALEAWRDHGRAVHRGLDSAPTERHDGLVVVRAGDVGVEDPGRLVTLGRLARDFRSPEPLVAAVGAGAVAVSARDHGAADAAATLVTELAATDGTWTGDERAALARVDPDAPVSEVVAAIRGRSA